MPKISISQQITAAAVHAVNVCRTLNIFGRDAFMLAIVHPPSSVPECRWRHAGLINCSLADLFHMASPVQYGRTPGISRALTVRAGSQNFRGGFPRGCRRVLRKQRNGVVNLFSVRRRTIAHAAIAQRKAGCYREVFFLPHCQFVLLRQFDRRRRAHLFAAAAEDAAAKIELPRQLIGRKIGFPPSARSTGRRGTQAAQPCTTARIMFGLPRKFLSTTGSSG